MGSQGETTDSQSSDEGFTTTLRLAALRYGTGRRWAEGILVMCERNVSKMLVWDT